MAQQKAFCSVDCDAVISNTLDTEPRERRETVYAQINPVTFVEFAPSRETRESEHIALKEHSSPSAVRGKLTNNRSPTTVKSGPGKRRNGGVIQYADVDFSSSSYSITSPDKSKDPPNRTLTMLEVAGAVKSDNYENLLRRVPVQSSPTSGRSIPCTLSPPHTPVATLKFLGKAKEGRDDYEQFVLGSRTPTKAETADLDEVFESRVTLESSQEVETDGSAISRDDDSQNRVSSSSPVADGSLYSRRALPPRPPLKKAKSDPNLISCKAATLLGLTEQDLVDMKSDGASPSPESIADCGCAIKPRDTEYRRDLTGLHNSYSFLSEDNIFHLSYLGSQSVERTYGVLGEVADQMIKQSKDTGVEMTVILSPLKLEVRPGVDKEGLTFSTKQIEGIDAGEVAGILAVGFVVVTDEAAMCHVFSAKEENRALQMCRQVSALFHSDHDVEENTTADEMPDNKFCCRYMGMTIASQPQGVLFECIDTLLHNRDPIQSVHVQMSVNKLAIVCKLKDLSTDVCNHNPENVKAIDVFELDSRVFGYILDTQSGYECHCFRSSSPSVATKIARTLRIAVQEAFRMKNNFTEPIKKGENGSLGKFVSRLRRWRSSYVAKKQITLHPTSRSYFYTSLSTDSCPLQEDTCAIDCLQSRERCSTSSFFVDLEGSLPNRGLSTSMPSSSDNNLSSPIKSQTYTAIYVGSATAELPASGQMVIDLLLKMETEGAAAGLSGDGKTIIQIKLSPQAVTLIDANEKAFFRRYYSKGALAGLARHSHEKDIIGMWTQSKRPPAVTKCHIFKKAMHNMTSIVQAFEQNFDLKCD